MSERDRSYRAAGQHEPGRRLLGQRVAESFFASLKLELVYQVQWRTRVEAGTAIFEYPRVSL
ncbi:MAG: IS3 family transposase [Candidatus Binataceae bacterium]|nr:IS3 family transposase [Candidatus Binataceae bacterium]